MSSLWLEMRLKKNLTGIRKKLYRQTAVMPPKKAVKAIFMGSDTIFSASHSTMRAVQKSAAASDRGERNLYIRSDLIEPP